MNKLRSLILIAASAVLVCSAMGQGRRGGFGPPDALQLANRDDVAQDLGLSADQKSKLSDLAEKNQQKMQDAMQEVRDSAGDDRDAMMKGMMAAREKISAENAKAVAAILTPDQVKRLKEILIQFSGVTIVTSNKEIQADLGITDDQKAKFADLQTRQMAAMRELFQNAQGDRDAMRAGMEKNRKAMEDEVGKILTDSQKAKLTEMGGTKKFVRVDPPAGGGR